MKMKRSLSVLLTGIMALSLVACGGSSAPAESSDLGAAAQEATPAASEPAAETAASDSGD